jgi:ADP-ribose pyrophosphatase YjhB (NUDIX family)
MYHKPMVLAAAAIVFDAQGRVLLICRKHAPAAGSWTLPGGRAEPGESMQDAALRELHEETGLLGEHAALVTVVTLGRYEIHEHLVRTWSGAARAGDDAAAVRWAAPDEFDELGVTLEVRHVLDVARRFP